MPLPRYRLFLAAGPGNIIEAHRNWRSGHDDPSQMSITFSSEFAQLCEANNAEAYLVSSAAPARTLVEGRFKLQHRPKKIRHGWRYHLEEMRYGFSLLIAAVRFRATHAFIQSGTTHHFALSAFRLFGIRTIPIMHNTLWPSGYPQTSGLNQIIRYLDAGFFRHFANAVLAVSPECARQVDTITRGKHGPIEIFVPQFNERLFQPTEARSLNGKIVLCFAGRITENKGVFDLVEIAKRTNPIRPILIHICGDGPDLARLREATQKSGVAESIEIHGWTQPDQLRHILSESHLSIVPTRSDFSEGMAMTAIEPILLGRPVITSPVVPAHEVLGNACITAKTDDTESYVQAILALTSDQYIGLCRSCLTERLQFFDQSKSSQSAMQRVLGSIDAVAQRILT